MTDGRISAREGRLYQLFAAGKPSKKWWLVGVIRRG